MELAPTRQAQSLEDPITLPELVERARASARDYRDHRGILLPDTRMETDGTWCYNGESGRLSRHALSQLCGRLELPGGGSVPAGYLARCPAPLAAENLNHWLSHPSRHEQQVLVRTRTEPSGSPWVRAVLSDRYATVDHLPLLQSLSEQLSRHQLSLQGWSLDDEQLTLRFLVNRDHPATLDDPLRVGVHVTNSEIGLSRISLTALITRLVCTNGLVVRVADLGGIHRRHIGRVGENLQDVVRGAIPRVLEQAEEAANRFRALREEPVPGPVERYVERVTREAELPETLSPLVLADLEGETLYDLVNGFTRAAQRYPVSERVRIETAMSRFLRDGRNWNKNLPPSHPVGCARGSSSVPSRFVQSSEVRRAGRF